MQSAAAAPSPESLIVYTVTVLVYDAFITLDKEARYFWKISRRAVNYVYFVNRYVGILGSVAYLFWSIYGVDLALCERQSLDGMRIDGITLDWMIIISIDYILLIRVLALYSQDTRLSMCLTLLLILEVILKLAFLIYLIVIEHCKSSAQVVVEMLMPVLDVRLGMADWLILMTYGVILMILALYKAAKFWKISAGFKGFMLVKVLIRDQVLYFMLVIACCIFAILEFRLQFSNVFFAGILNALGNPAFLTILGSWMVFNLKEAGERGQNEGISYRLLSRVISDMNFAEPNAS
ncbi:hypothetical protein ACEPAF_10006 [Sanghuangporus sanghuang]